MKFDEELGYSYDHIPPVYQIVLLFYFVVFLFMLNFLVISCYAREWYTKQRTYPVITESNPKPLEQVIIIIAAFWKLFGFIFVVISS